MQGRKLNRHSAPCASHLSHPGCIKYADRCAARSASREIGGRTTTETGRYYLLSKAVPPERFDDIVRSH